MFSEILFVLYILLTCVISIQQIKVLSSTAVCFSFAITSRSYGQIVNNNGIEEGFRCDRSEGLEYSQGVDSGYLLDSTSPGREARGTTEI